MLNSDLERIKRSIKNKKVKHSSLIFDRILNRFLITALVTVLCLITLKRDEAIKSFFYNKVLSVNFNFAYINNLYNEYFGGSLPFSNVFEETSTVFNESLSYNSFSDYLDGVSLDVGSNYLVPVLDTGLIVFVGEKEGYGNTIIVQQVNGIDVWYSNMSNISVSMYEYVSKGSFIGSCENNLYLVFKKDGNILDYKRYI